MHACQTLNKIWQASFQGSPFLLKHSLQNERAVTGKEVQVWILRLMLDQNSLAMTA